MKIAVFGATGRTGVPLCQQTLDRGHDAVAHARSPDKSHTRSPEKSPTRLPDKFDVSIAREALTVVEGDAYAGTGVRETVRGTDAVVSVLGQGEGSPGDLLTVTGRHVLDAMGAEGVSRYVTLVGAGVRKEGESRSMGDRVMGVALKLLAGDVLEDASAHVEDVRERDLAWTVLRVPRLTEGDPDGSYRAGDIRLGFDAIDRADVARCILDCLEEERFVGELPKAGSA